MSLFKETSRYGVVFLMLFLSQSDPAFWERFGFEGAPVAFQALDLAGTLRHLHSTGVDHMRVVDARPRARFAAGHIPGARSLQEIPESVGDCPDLADAGELLIYCDNSLCSRAEVVAGKMGRFLSARLYVYRGGWEEWSSAGLPVER